MCGQTALRMYDQSLVLGIETQKARLFLFGKRAGQTESFYQFPREMFRIRGASAAPAYV